VLTAKQETLEPEEAKLVDEDLMKDSKMKPVGEEA